MNARTTNVCRVQLMAVARHMAAMQETPPVRPLADIDCLPFALL